MPASPEHGARLASQIVATIEALEQTILRLLSAHLASGASRDDWATTRLAELQMLRARVTRLTTATADGIPDRVRTIVLEAYNHGSALALADLDRAGLPGAVTATPIDTTAAAAAAAIDQVLAALRQVPQLVSDVYLDAVRAGTGQVLAGNLTRLQASQQVLDRLASQGLTGFTDRAGRRWSLESYAEMAVRTVSGHAAIEGHVDMLAAAGHDLVIVSDSPRECPLCRPFERQVLSISGRVGKVLQPSAVGDGAVVVDVKASLAEARAAGFQHPNCRHDLSLYVPGVTTSGNATAQPGRYDAGQRQRAIERHIRGWKRREAAAMTPQAAATARAKVRQWQAAQRAHVAEHGLRRLPYRERVGTPATPLAH